MSNDPNRQTINTDMDEKMQKFVLESCDEAVRATKSQKEVADLLKQRMCSRYPGVWQCIVGASFASAITCEAGTFMNFYFDRHAILLFRSG
ncbi:unnamed protein product [Dicrocoelium dendriticum]|nr:unnamed protein product [Dicrocoelium dendriticum]